MKLSSAYRHLFSLCLSILLMAFFIVQAHAAVEPEHPESFAPLRPILGTSQVCANGGVIDYSNNAEGYVMCRYTGTSVKAAVRIEKEGSLKVYTYFLDPTKQEYEAFPLTQKDGSYRITLWERLSGNTYAQVVSVGIEVELRNEYSPFLYSSSMIPFDGDSACTAKAKELTIGLSSNQDKVRAILDFITNDIAYDNEKAAATVSGYRSSPDDTLEAGSGICTDYAVLAAAMLRSQGIPTKMIYGYNPEDGYHAWIHVYTDAWRRYDPTRTAQTKQPAPKSGYTAQYVY